LQGPKPNAKFAGYDVRPAEERDVEACNKLWEIRVRDESGAFRLMYVAKFPEAVYVLHAFEKKTRATSRHAAA